MSGVPVLLKLAVVGGSLGSLLLISYKIIEFMKNRRSHLRPRVSKLGMRKGTKKSSTPVDINSASLKTGEDLGPYFDEENGVDSSRLDTEKLKFYKHVRQVPKKPKSTNNGNGNSYCN